MAAGAPSSLEEVIALAAATGDQYQEDAFAAFFAVLQGNPTPGEVAAEVARLGISLETAAKIMSIAGKSKDFIEKVYDAARM